MSIDCKKKFDIPNLDEKSWEEVQAGLDAINKLLRDMESLLKNNEKIIDKFDAEMQKYVERMHIELGLLDSVLGRTYTLEEVNKMLKELKKKKGEKHGLA